MNYSRPGRTVSSKGTLLNAIRANTVTLENSFYCRTPRIWNTLPAHLRNTDWSVAHFARRIFLFTTCISLSLFMTDVDTPQTFKSVCIKCHTSRPLNSLLDRMCCWFFIDVLPSSVYAFPYLFFVVLSFLLAVLLINFSFFFLELVGELALWVIQASWRCV